MYRSIDWLVDWPTNWNINKRFKFSDIVFNSFSSFIICRMENRNHNKCNHRSTSISILVVAWNSRHILACHNDNMFHLFGRLSSDIRGNMWRMDELNWNLFADYLCGCGNCHSQNSIAFHDYFYVSFSGIRANMGNIFLFFIFWNPKLFLAAGLYSVYCLSPLLQIYSGCNMELHWGML